MSLVEDALSAVLETVADAAEDVDGEFFRPKKKRKEPEEESAFSKAWRKQFEDENAAAARRKLKPKRRAVITFGRFNPPTTGHQRVFDYVQAQAAGADAMPFVFTSVKQDEDNPLPYAEKVQWLRRLFGLPVVSNPKVRHPMDALGMLQGAGFDDVTFVVGSDQAAEFNRIAGYAQKKGIRADVSRKALKNVRVVTVPEQRDDRALDTSGVSGTKQRKAAKAGNYLAFRRGVPTKQEAVARKLYYTVRKHMGLTKGHAFLICGFSLQGAQSLREAFGKLVPRVVQFDAKAHRLMEQAKPFYVDLSGQSAQTIRGLVRTLGEANYRTTIYLKGAPMPKQLSESWVKSQATFGMLKSLRNAVVVESAARAYRHAKALMEEGEAGKPKEPSDVDRLKVRQKQDQLSLKQRQSNDLLAAKQRELQKKSREDQQKIANSQKPTAEAR